MLGLSLDLSRLSGGADFSFMDDLGGGFFGVDFTQSPPAIKVPKDLGGGVYSTTEAEITSDLTEAFNIVSGGDSYLVQDKDGTYTDKADGEFPIDFGQFGSGIMQTTGTVTRLTPLDPESLNKAGSPTVVDNGSLGALNDVTYTAASTSNRLFHTAAKFTSGNYYNTTILVDCGGSDTTTCSVSMITNTSGDKATVRFNIDLSGSSPALGTPTTFVGGAGVNWSDVSTNSVDVGGGRYIVELTALCNFTGGASDRTDIYPDISVGTGSLRLLAVQTTETDHFPGWVGGDQTIANVTRSEIQIEFSERVADALASLGTNPLTTALSVQTAHDLTTQLHALQLVNNTTHSFRSDSSGNAVFQTGNGSLTGSQVLRGKTTMVGNDADGTKASFNGATVTSTGSGTTDKSAITGSDTGVGATTTHSMNWTGGLQQIVMRAADVPNATMEGWGQ